MLSNFNGLSYIRYMAGVEQSNVLNKCEFDVCVYVCVNVRVNLSPLCHAKIKTHTKCMNHYNVNRDVGVK